MELNVSASPLRCPFCHADFAAADADWVACEECLARHHRACWDEALRCSTCGGGRRLLPNPTRRSPARTLAFVGILLAVGLPVGFALSRDTAPVVSPGAATPAERDRAVGLVGRALVHLAANDTDAAIAEASEAIDLDPTFPAAWHARGRAQLARGDAKRALADLDAAVRADPSIGPPAELYEQRALARRGLGDLAGAVGDAEKAVELDGRSAALWTSLGDARLASGDGSGAVAAFARAIERDENHAEAYRGRALAFERLGDARAAHSDWLSFRELVPPSSKDALEANQALERTRRS